VQLKLAQNRLALVRQKKANLNAQARREIATLLEQGKEQSARIRVETIIREDFLIEGMELVSLHVDTLLARFALLEQQGVDPGISESLIVVLYAAPRIDIKELMNFREQMVYKLGKDFVLGCSDNYKGNVNPRVVHNIGVITVDPQLVSGYLNNIAEAYKLDWRDEVEIKEQVSVQPSQPVSQVPYQPITPLAPQLSSDGRPSDTTQVSYLTIDR
ncbi:regulator of Vps4 activity in the MVB pathway-domain-containing protein, partial [Gorgonomyces haynaldii]